MSHSDRRAFLRALALLPFSATAVELSAQIWRLDTFRRGWNHPWIGYGHDFGTAWGHDGLSTSGWTCETDPSARGFTGSAVTANPDSGRGALRIDAHLVGGDPSRSTGAVYLSLADHWPPSSCPPPANASALNLDGVLVRYRIWLPKGSAGSAEAPNVLQLFLKTRVSAEQWRSMVTTPVAISSSWEERYVDLVVRLDVRDAAHVDPDFDIQRVSLIGLSMSVGNRLPAPVRGTIWIDEVAIETPERLVFDFERTELEAQLYNIRRRAGRGLSLMRFFIFCDGRAVPAFAADGTVMGLDDVFYRDFDVLVQAAERQGVGLVPVLLDFGWCAYPRTVSGVQLGGHADVIRDPIKRQSFFDRALKPLLERYGTHPAIVAWDVCNEPEWVLDDIPQAFRRDHEVVSAAEMRAFVQGCAQYVHRLAPTQLVTVGSARRMWLPLWTGCDLDFYQFHWYDHFHREEPFPWAPYDELGLDRPCLIGEVPTEGTAITPQQFLSAAQAGGYSGLLFWSYAARDAASNMCSMLEEVPRVRPPIRQN